MYDISEYTFSKRLQNFPDHLNYGVCGDLANNKSACRRARTEKSRSSDQPKLNKALSKVDFPLLNTTLNSNID